MLRRHVAGDLTGLGQLAHRVATLQEHLHHPQPMGMRRVSSGIRPPGQASSGVSFGRPVVLYLIATSSAVLPTYNISQYLDMSI